MHAAKLETLAQNPLEVVDRAPGVLAETTRKKRDIGREIHTAGDHGNGLAHVAQKERRAKAGSTVELHSIVYKGTLPALPETKLDAFERIARIGYELGAKIDPNDTASLKTAQKFLRQAYPGTYAESLGDQRTYLRDADYQLRLLSDSRGPTGTVSAWNYPGTGLQIDYITSIDAARQAHAKKDVAAGFAAAMAIAHDVGAKRLFVELDSTFAQPYARAGFEKFAGRASGHEYTKLVAACHTAGVTIDTLEMHTLSLVPEKLGAKEKRELWKAHVAAWYESNWDGVSGEGRELARRAQELMNAAADRGRYIWIQVLPNRE